MAVEAVSERMFVALLASLVIVPAAAVNRNQKRSQMSRPASRRRPSPPTLPPARGSWLGRSEDITRLPSVPQDTLAARPTESVDT